MDLERLRRETASDHLAVEGSVPLMGEDLTRKRYVLCLMRLHGVVAGWEEWAARNAPIWLLPLVVARRRAPLLTSDLAWFGKTELSPARPALPQMKGTASILGAMYVMEGSTLGGQLIARHVERVLSLTPGEGDAYFRGHEQRTGAMWKQFREVLESQTRESDSEALIASAKAMFRTFGSWMESAEPEFASIENLAWGQE